MNKNGEIKEYMPVMTVFLIAANAVVFVLQLINGGSEDTGSLVKMGAFYAPFVLEEGQWYRLFNPMFLHIGLEHLLFNMLALFSTGQYIEQYFGRVRFVIIYLLSGIAGNALTLFGELLITHHFAVSAGASGAVSGLFGAMVILAIDKRTGRYFSLPRVLIGLLFLIFPGGGTENINVTAHVGGMICGFLTGLFFYLIRKKPGY
ncbi:MAG: rhomboid family intramembrane serine protease [Lachnospiraceae bacterium]|nr:rhomboid family intramembrane serine protease [Lachnospiraceae bacterium]